MTDPTRCEHCGTRFPPSCVTFFVAHERSPGPGLSFCDERCAGRWALVEVGRFRGWLNRIVARTRGTASGLASQALHSNWFVGGAPPKSRK